MFKPAAKIKETIRFLSHASFKGSIKAAIAYTKIKADTIWIPKTYLPPPYPPDSKQKENSIQLHRLQIPYLKKNIFLTGYSFWSRFLAAKEVFLEKEYDWLGVKGKQVIDIGAFTGDTAIDFATRGAKIVYSYEANPTLISLINYNLVANGVSKKVNLFNYLIGKNKPHKSNIYIDDQNMVTHAKNLKQHKLLHKNNIKVVCLDELVKKHKIENGILKMDIEGAEYDVINSTSIKTFQSFSQMQIDFHKMEGRTAEQIIKRLSKARFQCTKFEVGTMQGGYIQATRNLT